MYFSIIAHNIHAFLFSLPRADTLGAYAICLSGGYKDDEDEGTTFWYTGQGGNTKGLQVSHGEPQNQFVPPGMYFIMVLHFQFSDKGSDLGEG